MLQALIDKSQEYVNGTVRLKLYKGSVSVVGRKSDDSLFDEKSRLLKMMLVLMIRKTQKVLSV